MADADHQQYLKKEKVYAKIQSEYGNQFVSAREAQLELILAERDKEIERLTQYAQAFNMEHVVGRIITGIKTAIPPTPKPPETPEQAYLARMRRDNAASREQAARQKEEQESADWCYCHHTYTEDCGC